MTVSARQLNRTYLRRQLLLQPDPRPVHEVVAHLVAVQAQDPDAPYVGLWTRMADLTHDDLTTALTDRRLVRGTLLRNTQHITAAADYRWLQPLLRARFGGRSPFSRQLDGLGPGSLAAAAREILTGREMTRPRLAKELSGRFPGHDPMPLAWAAQLELPLVHPPPTGTWRRRGHVSLALAEEWMGAPVEAPSTAGASTETLVGRYLAACGPATVADLQTWCGLRRLKADVADIRTRLTVHRDESGRELLDLPDLPLADADEPAPVRFLPEFDNLVLSHADRTRVISDEDRRIVCPGYSVVRPTFLVDGHVAGIWAVRADVLTVTPLRPLRPTDADEVSAEALRLLDFLQLGPAATVELTGTVR